MSELITPEIKKEIDVWVAKFPKDQKQSAVLSALHIMQDHHDGWLSRDCLDAVADYLEMSHVAVYEVATFYTMFDLEKKGKTKINVCTNISCMLNGSENIMKHLEMRLGVKCGETTPDGKYTLREVECLGACVNAPMCQIGKKYHEHLTLDKVDELLEEME